MALPAEPLDRAALPAPPGAYNWFLVGVGSWYGSWGLQAVLFSWLVVGVLGETAERVGVAQFALVAPSLLLLLAAGAAADRADRRRLLAVLHGLAAALTAALVAVVASGVLSFPLLIAYALAMGTISAWAVPTRDSLVNDVASANLLRAVIGVTIVQFVANGAGTLTGGAARYTGTGAMLAGQAVVLLVGAWASYRLPAAMSRANTHEAAGGGEVLAGLREVLGSNVMRPAWLLMVSVGLFFMGPYAVVFPVLVRDVYGGGVGSLSLVLMTFPIGSVLGSLLLLRRGYVRRKGRALALSLGVAACALLVVGLGAPFPLALGAGVVWGLAGGVFMNTGRAIFQETAPPTHRARVLSVYNLGFMGGGTLGTPLAGLLAGSVGPLEAFLVCGCAMLLVVAATYTLTGISRIES